MKQKKRTLLLLLALLLCCTTACSTPAETRSEVTTATATTQSTTDVATTTVTTTTTTVTTTTASTTVTTKPTTTKISTMATTTTESDYHRLSMEFYDVVNQNKEEIVSYLWYIRDEFLNGNKKNKYSQYYGDDVLWLTSEDAIQNDSDPISQQFFAEHNQIAILVLRPTGTTEGSYCANMQLASYDEQGKVYTPIVFYLRYYYDKTARNSVIQAIKEGGELIGTDNGLFFDY